MTFFQPKYEEDHLGTHHVVIPDAGVHESSPSLIQRCYSCCYSY